MAPLSQAKHWEFSAIALYMCCIPTPLVVPPQLWRGTFWPQFSLKDTCTPYRPACDNPHHARLEEHTTPLFP